MAEIIKKERIQIKNGDLKKLCKKNNTSVDRVQKELKLNSDLLYKFDRGERTITWEMWEEINKTLKNINKLAQSMKDWKAQQ